MSSIKISPEHGLNPTIPVCCWCGNPKNEIALLGRIHEKDKNGKTIPNSDVEAPHYAVMDYNPCDDCTAAWADAVVFLEVTHNQPADKRPPISKEDNQPIYPTFRAMGVSEETAGKIAPGMNLKTGARCFMEDIAFEKIFGDVIRDMQNTDSESE